MADILVGITSWTEKTLVESGLFYPPDVKTPEARLRFYAGQFPVVEVDSSYYALPTARNAQLWAERTPAGFIFDIKAFRLLTQHQTPPSALPKDIREAVGPPGKANLYLADLASELLDEIWRRFLGAIMPLDKTGKLGTVLFQFPPWFVYRPAHLDYLAECVARLPGIPVAVEFRNRSWLDERHRQEVLDAERRLGITHVVVDEPQGSPASVPAVWEVTNPGLAVVRLHGRNAATWQARGLASAAERFDYLYGEDELRALASPIGELGERAARVHVLLNNCYRDHATRNARQLCAYVHAAS
jgi:uncharacterized protein YecE (DUF72 family)